MGAAKGKSIGSRSVSGHQDAVELFQHLSQDTATLCVTIRGGRELTQKMASVCCVRSLAVFQVARMQLNCSGFLVKIMLPSVSQSGVAGN